jgi:hypothetical protein
MSYLMRTGAEALYERGGGAWGIGVGQMVHFGQKGVYPVTSDRTYRHKLRIFACGMPEMSHYGGVSTPVMGGMGGRGEWPATCGFVPFGGTNCPDLA